MAVLLNLCVGYRLNNQPQLSYNALQKARGLINKATSKETLAFYFSELGSTQFDLGNHKIGLENQKKAIEIYQSTNNLRRLSTVYNSIALCFDKIMQLDSCTFYAQKGLLSAKSIGFKREMLIAAKLLAKIFELKDSRKAMEYYKIAMNTNDELYGVNNVLELQKIVFEEQEKQRKAELEQINTKNRLKQYALLSGLGVLFLIGFILYRNYQIQKKTNAELNKTLSTLKSTQAQLIQKEKLASLGELTAGIAHEIQNPLNFVNNFSELSVGIAQDLEEEIKNSPLTPNGGIIIEDKTYFNELISDLTQNQEKINHHGKRASSIVKGMLEHSRQSTGERELTDINQLADEYLRLAYHGLRAKDNSFNCDYELIADENLPKIEVIPQDIGRVLLNIINNAFYATQQRFRPLQGDKVAYLPKITISTEVIDNQIIIKVKDNGIGMSETTKSKIFQPFFTTKPTGEGTGLGLSLSYDIITKGHGGTIEVESVEGEEVTFIVKLPVT